MARKYIVALHGSLLMPDRSHRTAGMSVMDHELKSSLITQLVKEGRLRYAGDFDPETQKGIVPGSNQIKATDGTDPNSPDLARTLGESIKTNIPTKTDAQLQPPLPPGVTKGPDGKLYDANGELFVQEPGDEADEAVLGNPGVWNFKKEDLQDKTLEQLNIMAAEKDPAVKPFTDLTEAIEFMSKDGNVQQA